MTTLENLNTKLSRFIATNSENYFDPDTRAQALNDAAVEFVHEYNPPELRKKAALVPRLDGIPVHDCDAFNSALYGTFAASSDAQNLATDTANKVEGDGSISFDIVPALSGDNFADVSVASLTSLNLNSLEGTGLFRLSAFLPNVTNLSSVEIWLGTDVSNYWSMSATLDINGNPFAANAENKLEFDWANATQNGTPDASAITYLKVRINYTVSFAGGTGYRIDNIRAFGAGTPKIDDNYLIADLPSDFYTINSARELKNSTTGDEIVEAGPDNFMLGRALWTTDYNLTYQTQKIYIGETSHLGQALILTYYRSAGSLVNNSDDNGLSPRTDRLIVCKAGRILFADYGDLNGIQKAKDEEAKATRAWSGKESVVNRRLKSRFERTGFHSRV